MKITCEAQWTPPYIEVIEPNSKNLIFPVKCSKRAILRLTSPFWFWNVFIQFFKKKLKKKEEEKSTVNAN